MDPSAQENQNLQPQIQRASPKVISWSKVIVTIVVIVVTTAILGAIYYFFILDKLDFGPPENIKTTTPSAQPATPSAKKDETADWNTFTAKKVNISLKYPENWFDATNKAGLDNSEYFSANEFFHATHPKAGDNYPYATISLTVSRVSPGSELEKFVTKNYSFVSNLNIGEKTSMEGFTYIRKPNITVANISSIQYSTEGDNATPKYGLHSVIKKENTFYYLHLASNTVKGLKDNRNIYDLFVSSFKFLPSP